MDTHKNLRMPRNVQNICISQYRPYPNLLSVFKIQKQPKLAAWEWGSGKVPAPCSRDPKFFETSFFVVATPFPLYLRKLEYKRIIVFALIFHLLSAKAPPYSVNLSWNIISLLEQLVLQFPLCQVRGYFNDERPIILIQHIFKLLQTLPWRFLKKTHTTTDTTQLILTISLKLFCTFVHLYMFFVLW